MRLVEIFKSLGEKNRIRIINILLESRVCVCEIQDITGISQVNASKHLAKLRDSNIVYTEKEAQRVFYNLSSEISDNESLKEVIKSYRDGEVFKKDLLKLKEIRESGNDYSCPKE